MNILKFILMLLLRLAVVFGVIGLIALGLWALLYWLLI